MGLLGSDSVEIAGWAAVITAIGVIIGAFLKHINVKDERTERTIVQIVDRQNASIDKHTISLDNLNRESSERSQAIVRCMQETKQVTAVADATLKTVDSTLKEAVQLIDEHKEVLAEYRRQNNQRAVT